MILKTCKSCNLEKDLSEFYKDKSKKDGYQWKCKVCKKSENNAWYHTNKDNYNISRKSPSKRIRATELKRLSVKKKLEEDSNYIKKNNLKNTYGITISQYEELFTNAENKCQICGISSDESYTREGRNLCIDHCHKTGIIRGILCNQCNSALGKFRDSEELLLKAIEYLRIKETI